MSSRSRRYVSNLAVAESHYKSAMDRLDASRVKKEESSSAESSSTLVVAASPKSNYDYNGDALDARLAEARMRASMTISENTILDEKQPSTMESDFDSQIQATLARIRESKKMLSNINLQDDVENLKVQSKAELSKKLASVSSSSLSMSSKSVSESRKSVKVSAVSESVADVKSTACVKWKDETAESFAAKRADATKLRLKDIEDEMAEFDAKQAERAKRAIEIRKLLDETKAFDESYGSATSAVSSSKAVSSVKSVRTVKKVVSY